MQEVLTNISDAVKDFGSNNLVSTVFIIIFSYAFYRMIASIIKHTDKRTRSQRRRTYTRLLMTIIRACFILMTFLVVLEVNGVNVTSLLAGVGIAGAVIGLAIQDGLKDIIRGFSILADGYFEVGDVVQYGDHIGKVSVLGLKTTKIKDIADGSVYSIANRNIEEVQVLSKLIYLSIPLSYELKTATANKAFESVTARAAQIPCVAKCTYLGVKSLEASAKMHLLEIELTDAAERNKARRLVLQEALAVFEDQKIEIPYDQLDIHTK